MARDDPASTARVEQQRRTEVQVRWGNPEHLDPVYADQMHITRMNDQYYLTFGQLRPTFADVGKGVPATVTAEVRPMVRLIVSKESLQKMLDLLGKSVEKISEAR